MKHIRLFLIMLYVAVVAEAQTFEEALHIVANNNLSLAATLAKIEGDKALMKSENNLPDTEIGYEQKWSNSGLGAKWGVSISQGFEWPGIYSERGEAIALSSQALDFLYKSEYLDKLVEIKLLLIDIVNTRKRISLLHQIDETMQQLKAKYAEGYAQGEVTILDINKIEIQQISIKRQYNSLIAQMAVLENQLLAENGGNDCSMIIESLTEYPEEILMSVDVYAELIENSDPLLHYNTLQLEAKAKNYSVAKMGRYPGFSIGYIHENELGEHFNGFSIGVSLPFFSQRHKTTMAEAIRQSATYDLNAIKTQRLTTMYAQRATAVTLYQEIEMYRPIFEDSNNLDLLRKALDGGQMSLLDYLQEVNFFLQARLDYMDVVYQYHQQLTHLNRNLLIK